MKENLRVPERKVGFLILAFDGIGGSGIKFHPAYLLFICAHSSHACAPAFRELSPGKGWVTTREI